MSNSRKRKATEAPQTVEEIIEHLPEPEEEPEELSGLQQVVEEIKKFLNGVFPRGRLPTLEELKFNANYDISKEEMIYAISICVKIIRAAAKQDRFEREHDETVDVLKEKWQRCADKDSPHCAQIIQDRSLDEVREMLASVLMDLEIWVEINGQTARSAGVEIRSYADARRPQPGKDWY